jgi:type IV secretory pathway VirB2 component (pilin)
MKAVYKKIFSALALSMLLGFALMPLQAGAITAPNVAETNFNIAGTNTFTGFDVGNVAADPRDVIKRIINVVMGFLGMIAVLIILFAGFKWMTAGGNKENMEGAQKLLINGIIGLVIVFSAWTVAWFAVNTIKVNVGG